MQEQAVAAGLVHVVGWRIERRGLIGRRRVVGWIGGGAGRAVVKADDLTTFGAAGARPLTVVDPSSANVVPGSVPQLAITAVKDGSTRVFHVHPDDVRFTKDADCRWAGSRYVILEAQRLGLIDVQSLKMNYPFPKGDDVDVSYEFSPDLAWVVRRSPDGIDVAKMMPAASP